MQTGLLLLVRERRTRLIQDLGMAPGSVAAEKENPYEDCEKLKEVYQLSFNTCGDTLSSRLPIESVSNVYFPKSLPKVSLADDDSKKSGEELLQQFLPSIRRGRGRRSFETGEFDEDYDDDRSSDDLSFVGEGDADLTIKATVSDPGKGIKLLIGKKSKSRLSEAESQDSENESTKTPPRLTAYRKPTRPMRQYSDFFEWTTIKAPSIQFVFSYAGRIQRCKSIERRKSSVVEPPVIPGFQSSEFQRLSRQMPLSGRSKALTKQAKCKSQCHRLLPQSLLTALL
jgi:hypothetical protein